MNSVLKRHRFILGNDYFQFAPWTSDIYQLGPLFLEKFSFLNFALGSIAIGPLDFGVIWKTVLGFYLTNLVLN
jgi:hypothetical protein